MSVTHTSILHEVNELIGEGSLEDAATLNASFNADNLLEENHQVFNNVYLEVSIAGADTLSAAQKEELFAIAEQCPLTGGRAVYQARAFLSWALDSTINYDDTCAVDENLRKAYNDITFKSRLFRLYPNPSNGNMQLDYTLQKNETGILSIYNLLGKKLYEFNLKEGLSNLIVNTDKLLSGVYLYKIDINTKEVFMDKIVIIR